MTEAEAFKVLGIPSTATNEEIHKRYRALALEWHPDVAGPSDRWPKVQAAHDFLMDPAQRLPEGVIKELKRKLKVVRDMIAVVDSRVKCMREDDPRIPGMYEPLRAKEKDLTEQLGVLV